MKKNILVTGGAGFIGSNLVASLLKDDRVGQVRVLDNISTGFYTNISSFISNPNFEFIDGDIRNFETCVEACKGMDLISHQAALGSVPRSINDPVKSNAVNVSGTVNIFTAARDQKIRRVVYAASSSTYGDDSLLPKNEKTIGRPLSPYAVSKYVMELYAQVFGDLYDMDFIGLRYFNVFGPKQNPNGQYAAVIPLFFKAALESSPPKINGDGSYSRDFTYVANVVNANILSLFTDKQKAMNQVYNIACGQRTSILDLWKIICRILGVDIDAIHGPLRNGDIAHTQANISKAKEFLDYSPDVYLKDGLKKSALWYKTYFEKHSWVD
jgi:UDP-N-acetylglucosamine 4-epimerase